MPSEQDFADALKLAPSAGDPASGSVYSQLENIVGPGGGFVCTVQTNDTNGNPVPAVTVYASSDSAGRTLVGGPAISNSGGAATIIFQAGVQYLWQLKSSYTTPAPTQVTVTAAATFTLNTLTPFVAPTVGTYASRGDLENIFGIPNIIKWAILSANDPDSPDGPGRNHQPDQLGDRRGDGGLRERHAAGPVYAADHRERGQRLGHHRGGDLGRPLALPAPEAHATRRGRPADPRPVRRHFHLGGTANELRPFRQAPAGCGWSSTRAPTPPS